MYPAADLVDGGGAAEEEQCEAADAREDEDHGHSDEEGRSLEGTRRDGAEICETALAGELSGQPVAYAVVEEAEVASLRGVHSVPDPVRLDKTHYVDNSEQDGEDCPKHPNSSRVPNVVGLVDLGSLRSWEHRPRSPRNHGLVLIRYFANGAGDPGTDERSPISRPPK